VSNTLKTPLSIASNSEKEFRKVFPGFAERAKKRPSDLQGCGKLSSPDRAWCDTYCQTNYRWPWATTSMRSWFGVVTGHTSMPALRDSGRCSDTVTW